VSPSIATLNDIEVCLGVDVAGYAARKNTGGSAGNKGTRYEDIYAAFRITYFASELIGGSEEDPHVSSQIVGLVDDFRISTSKSTDYYQLKNKQQVTWSGGDHPIQDDFAHQFRLSSYLGETSPTTNLVVPCDVIRTTMEQNKPEAISAHSSVHHFPWLETANRLILENQDLRAWLSIVSNVESPTYDVLEGAFSALLSASLAYPQGAQVSALLARASRMYPGQIRIGPPEMNWMEFLRSDFKGVIDLIPELSYVATRGYFRWEALNMSGVFSYPIGSAEFSAFQESVVLRNPLTFDDFEELLP